MKGNPPCLLFKGGRKEGDFVVRNCRARSKVEIRIRELSKSYFSGGKKITALGRVNLTIPSNRIFTLLGPSGCGKTTLLRCIVGLEMPDDGEISIGDQVLFSR